MFGFFHSEYLITSEFIHVLIAYSFFFLSSIFILSEYTTIYLCTCLLMDVWILNRFCYR